MPTKQELQRLIKELQEENDELQDQLDQGGGYCVTAGGRRGRRDEDGDEEGEE
jgi:hypothetical protein